MAQALHHHCLPVGLPSLAAATPAVPDHPSPLLPRSWNQIVMQAKAEHKTNKLIQTGGRLGGPVGGPDAASYRARWHCFQPRQRRCAAGRRRAPPGCPAPSSAAGSLGYWFEQVAPCPAKASVPFYTHVLEVSR